MPILFLHLFCRDNTKRKVAQAAFSFCTLHSSLFSKSPARLFQRRDKREKKDVAFRCGEKHFLLYQVEK